MTAQYGSPRGKAGVSRTDSADELTSFFRLLANQLSQSPDDVIARMKEDEITVEDLAHMNKKDLYEYGIQTFSDAKLILKHAQNHGQLIRQRSGSQESRSTEGQLMRQRSVPVSHGSTDIEALLQKKLIDVPPSLRDVFAAHLDANLDGVPSWEQFGEKLLNMDATDLRQFQARDSPTKAILNKKVATDPSATLEDAFKALEAIGRKDVTELVLQKMGTTTMMSSKQESFDKSTPVLHASQFSDRLPLVHQSSSTDSGYGTTRQDNSMYNLSTRAQSEYSSVQHTQPAATTVDSNPHHMPVLTQANNVQACPQSTVLPKQFSVEQPNQSSAATPLPQQVPGLHKEQQNEVRGEPKLSELMNKVAARLPSKWRDVGIQLNLNPDHLDGIAASTSSSSLDRFYSVFTLWKKQVTAPYAWSTVIHALEAPAVNEIRLAEELRSSLKVDI